MNVPRHHAVNGHIKGCRAMLGKPADDIAFGDDPGNTTSTIVNQNSTYAMFPQKSCGLIYSITGRSLDNVRTFCRQYILNFHANPLVIYYNRITAPGAVWNKFGLVS